MAIKLRFDDSATLSAAGASVNFLAFTETRQTDEWEDTPVTIVDGVLTVVTDTDDLMGVRFLAPVPDLIVDGDLSDTNPVPDDPMVWYSWYCARGPLVFRMLTKRTIRPGNGVWIQVWKAQGSASTILRFGWQFMLQPHRG